MRENRLYDEKRGKRQMKKYLLLIENEELWKKFKDIIDKDINTEIMGLIKERVLKKKGGGK